MRGGRRLAGVLLVVGWALAACSGDPPSPGPSTTATSAAVTPTIEPVQDVVVAGHHFSAQCAGRGPGVLLVSGYGVRMGDGWAPVHTGLAELGRVCAYDRLGIGASDAPPERQTFEDMARDMDGVITALGLERPLVVVGHSLGGAVAATWATRHASDARALVLLDPSAPGFTQAYRAMLPAPDLADPELTGFLNREAEFDDPAKNLESLDPRAWSAYAALPSIAAPVHVLVRGVTEGAPPKMDGAALEAAWLAAEKRLVALSSKGTLTTAERSGHFVAGDRPDLVLRAVRDVLGS